MKKVINQYEAKVSCLLILNASNRPILDRLELVGSLAIFVITLLDDLFIPFLLIRLAPVTTVILL